MKAQGEGFRMEDGEGHSAGGILYHAALQARVRSSLPIYLATALESNPENKVLEDAEMGLLGFLCEEHTNAGVGSNPTAGMCWAADRLNPCWVGRRPDPRLLSTGAAGREERIACARELQREDFDREELYRDFGFR